MRGGRIAKRRYAEQVILRGLGSGSLEINGSPCLGLEG